MCTGQPRVFYFPNQKEKKQVIKIAMRTMATPPSNIGCELDLSLLPDDISLKIASFLQVSDLCSLSSSSKSWQNLCSSDCLWISLSKQRWPSRDISKELNGSGKGTGDSKEKNRYLLSTKGWKLFYIRCHQEMAGRANTVIRFLRKHSQYESIEVGDYLRAIGLLCSLDLGFADVQLFLFAKTDSVLLNLVGLHYSLFLLGIPAKEVMGALSGYKISDREVRIRWWMLGRWAYGFRQRDESRMRTLSLGELLKDEDVLWVLRRGAVHEVLRVEISAEIVNCAWSRRSIYS